MEEKFLIIILSVILITSSSGILNVKVARAAGNTLYVWGSEEWSSG